MVKALRFCRHHEAIRHSDTCNAFQLPAHKLLLHLRSEATYGALASSNAQARYERLSSLLLLLCRKYCIWPSNASPLICLESNLEERNTPSEPAGGGVAETTQLDYAGKNGRCQGSVKPGFHGGLP